MIGPIPGYDEIYETKGPKHSEDVVVTQYLSDFIFAIMFLRLSFLFVAYTNFSGYKTQFVKKICRENGCQPNNWFVIKLTFKKKPVEFVFSLLALSIVCIAFLWLVFEIEMWMKDEDLLFMRSPLLTSMYYVMITLTTIGYGDYYPRTTEGRFVTMAAAVWGAVLISLFVSATQDLFFMKD